MSSATGSSGGVGLELGLRERHGLVGHERLVLQDRLGPGAVVGLARGVALGGAVERQPRPRLLGRRRDLDQPRGLLRRLVADLRRCRRLGRRLFLTASRPESLGLLVAQLVLGHAVAAPKLEVLADGVLENTHRAKS